MATHNTIEFSGHSWKHGFTMVPNHILETDALTSGAKLTFALLMKFGRQEARAFPGQVRMSRYVQCTEKTLRAYITELKAVGLVDVQRRGQGMTNLYILHPDRELLPLGTVESTDLEGSPTTGEEDAGEEDTEEEHGADAPDRADEPQTLYDAFLAKVQGQPPRPITPSLRRTAEKALREFPLADLITAIDGFLAWRSKKAGDKRFSSIFASHPGGRPLHDHIEFWISQAGDASGLDGFPSGVRAKIVRAVREVQRGHGSRDTDAVQQATESMKFLESKGIECVRRSDGYPTFPALRRDS